MKLTILIILLILGTIVFWPRVKKTFAPKDFSKMTPKEIVYSWTVVTTMHVNVTLLANWVSETEIVISVMDPLTGDQKEKFDVMFEKLKKELPDDITVTVDVTD